jgi:hypothetical protein
VIVRVGLVATIAVACIGAAPAPVPTTIADAAESAFLMNCQLHAMQLDKIDDRDPAGIESMGLVLGSEGAPEEVLKDGPPGAGRKVIAKKQSLQGPVWITAYPESGWCMVFAKGDSANAAAKLRAALEAKGSFWTLVRTHAAEDGSFQLLSYRTGKNQAGNQLAAQLLVPSAPGPSASELVMLVVFPNNN